jgi:glycosyltransferase involved in cell wall biosynthesis
MAKGAVGRLPLLGLVMVVKDEAERIERVLASVKPLIDTWTICDTGSTDGTQKMIREQLAGIPGRLYTHKWRDFGHNRTLALARARGTARWLLMLDADEEILQVASDFRRWLGNRRDKRLQAYDVLVLDHESTYRVPYLTRGDLELRYVGVTHEYLKRSPDHYRLNLNGMVVTHHGKGPGYDYSEKLLRDIRLLEPEFRAGDSRAIFYTAESHRHLGHAEQAALIYELRAKMPEFEEERWYSAYQAARLRENVDLLLEVWRERPWRHEPLTAAAKLIAEKSGNGMTDVLFVERPPI